MFFYTFIPKLLNMSLTASVAIGLVILLRLLLKRAPKVISYALWGVVLFRLLCPVSVGSGFSLYNLFDTPTEKSGTLTSAIEFVPTDIVHREYPSVALPVPGISDVINEALPQGQEQLVADPLEAPMTFATYIWMVGVLVMVICSIASYIQLRRRLSVVVPLRDNIFIADDIKSPFVIGLIRPKIYLPCGLGEREREYIILHEQHHIRRLDHIIKGLAFLALCIHWFNPLVWLAFILACRDMEMSCDEAVIRKLGDEVRADYSTSLLTLATGRQVIAGTPLAFGEGDPKGRIKNLAKWKKPALWVVPAAAVCIVLALCLLTNPTASRDFPMPGINLSHLDPQEIIGQIAEIEGLEDASSLFVTHEGFDLLLTPDFDWAASGTVSFYYTKGRNTRNAQLRLFIDEGQYYVTDSRRCPQRERAFTLQTYLEALKYLPQEAVRALSPEADRYLLYIAAPNTPADPDRSIRYTDGGAGSGEGQHLRLTVLPLHGEESGYSGMGDEVIHLYYAPALQTAH